MCRRLQSTDKTVLKPVEDHCILSSLLALTVAYIEILKDSFTRTFASLNLFMSVPVKELLDSIH